MNNKRRMTNDEKVIQEAFGPCHDFWLFREGERTYKDYWDLLGRSDAPVRIPDDAIQYLHPSLQWIPNSIGHGLNLYGVTIFNHASGERLQKICSGWAQILSQGPESLELSYGWTCILDEEGKETNGQPYRFRTSRNELVQALEKLAQYGELIASGEYFLFHFGI
jgi:hypothetical protein